MLTLAQRIKRGRSPEAWSGRSCRWSSWICLRTRASFEAAMFLHGGHGIVLEPGRGSWSMGPTGRRDGSGYR